MKRNSTLLLIVASLLTGTFANAQTTPAYTIDSLLYSSHFTKASDLSDWIIEKSPADSERVMIQNHRLLLDTYGGATVWYKQELRGNILIRFKRTVVMQGGRNDRLSDFNQFWMATDPLQHRLFKRNGAFNEYDSLSMYYIGMGGNYNSTTRFRKYSERGDKKILGEFTDAPHLLQPNKEYQVSIVMKDGWILYIVDGETWFSYHDEQALTRGYFAFRSTRSRQEISEVQIYRVK